MNEKFIIKKDDPVLVTGANGFIGKVVVRTLLEYGFSNVRCFLRSDRNLKELKDIRKKFNNIKLEIVKGNLLSYEDCLKATENITIIFHLAAGIEKTFPGCYMNSVLTTKNLLSAANFNKSLKRFVNISSFAVYSTFRMRRHEKLDETCPVEDHYMERYEPYLYGKLKQEEMVKHYNEKYGINFNILRPGVVYGPGARTHITHRVGIDTFGFFLHLGGKNIIPLTYVDNCSDAIVLAGIKKGIENEIFNIVDDNLITSRAYLKFYKDKVRRFRSYFLPYPIFYLLSYVWEKYSIKSEGQLPPVFNRRRCASSWKGNKYTNKKLKTLLGWNPKINTKEGLETFFQSLKN